MQLATEINRLGLTGMWKRLRGRLRDEWFSRHERRVLEDRLCFDVEQLEQRVLLSGTIEGSIFVDVTKEGQLDIGETLLPGSAWTAYLDDDQDGIHDVGEPEAIPDSFGRFTFSDVSAGSHDVRVKSAPTGWSATTTGLATVTVTVGETSEALIGYAYDYIVDDDSDTDPAFEAIGGGWTYLTGATDAYGDNLTYTNTQNATGDPIIWTFTDLEPGHYHVQTTWPDESVLTQDAMYDVKEGSTVLSTVTLDQQLAPADEAYGGSYWQDLGTFEITQGTMSVELSSASVLISGPLMWGDAVRVRSASPVTILGENGVIEGATYRLKLDAAESVTLSRWHVNWGDGRSNVYSTNLAEGLLATHVYANGPSTRTVTATATDSTGKVHVRELEVTVADAAPMLDAKGASELAAGSTYRLELSAIDLGNDELTWEIDWGDNSEDTVVTGISLAVTHEYTGAASSTYDITVTATGESGTYTLATAAAGDLDTTFSSDGKARIDVNLLAANRSGVIQVIKGQEMVVLAGYAANFTSGYDEIAVVRLGADGELDPAFGNQGKAFVGITSDNDQAEDVIIQEVDGEQMLLVAGVAGLDGTSTGGDFFIMRLRENGTLDTSFGGITFPDGIVTVDFNSTKDIAYKLALQSDGKIVVTGNAGDDFGLLRLTADGELDTTFGSGGTGKVTFDFGGGSIDEAQAMVVLPEDDSLVVVGRAGETYGALHFDSDGTQDTSFGSPDFTGGKVLIDMNTIPGKTDEIAYAIARQEDGKLVIGGYSDGDFGLVRLNTDGTIDTGFGTAGTGKVIHDVAGNADRNYDLTIQPDGKIVAVGDTKPGYHHDFAMIRLDSDGTYDTTFGSGGEVITSVHGADKAWQVMLQEDGRIVVAGHSSSDFVAARYHHEKDKRSVEVIDAQNLDLISGSTSVDEGSTYTLTLDGTGGGTISRWTIDWGDGQVEVIPNPTGISSIDHVYADGFNAYTIIAEALDDNGVTRSSSVDVDVLDVAPTLTFTGGAVIDQADDYVLTLSIDDEPGDDTLEWIVDWGDGVEERFDEGFTRVTHKYPGGEANYLIMVRAVNEDGVYLAEPVNALTGVPIPDSLVNTVFNDGQVVLTNADDLDGVGANLDQGNRVLVQPDGKVLVAGKIEDNGDHFFVVTRYNIDGTVDETFGDTSPSSAGTAMQEVTGTITGAFSMAFHNDGILVGGRSDSGSYLMRLTADGEWDDTFGNNGIVATDLWVDGTGPSNALTGVFKFAVADDGGILLPGGNQGVADPFVRRFSADGLTSEDYVIDLPEAGALDEGNSGAHANAIAVQDDGGMIVVGTRGRDILQTMFVARLNSDGTEDTDFWPDSPSNKSYFLASKSELSGGDVEALEAMDVLIDRAGRIVVISRVFSPANEIGFFVMRLVQSSTGTTYELDSTFGGDRDNPADGPDGFAIITFDTPDIIDVPYSIAETPDGRLMIAGGAVDKKFAVAMLNENGSLEDTFGNQSPKDGRWVLEIEDENGVAVSAGVDALAMHPSGKVFLAGSQIDNTSSEPIILTGLLTADALPIRVVNQPPTLTIPNGTVKKGNIFTFDADAVDPDGDDALIEYSLLATPFDDPAGIIEIKSKDDATPGLITFDTSVTTPSITVGPYHFIVRATDQHGATTDVPFRVNVLPTTENRPPRLNASPPQDAKLGELYTFLVGATDPDGDALTFSIIDQDGVNITLDDPNTLSVTEAVTTLALGGTDLQRANIMWTPQLGELSEGTVDITLSVSDGSLSDSLTFPITVGNSDPVILFLPSGGTVVGEDYDGKIEASDPDIVDLPNLQYNFVNQAGVVQTGPINGKAIDVDSGEITWTNPQTSQNETLYIQVSDGRGGLSRIKSIDFVASSGGGTIRGTKQVDLTGVDNFDLSRFEITPSANSVIRYARTILDTDYITAGAAGMRVQGGDVSGEGTGEINLPSSFSGPVRAAYLYWHGPAVDDLMVNLIRQRYEVSGLTARFRLRLR